MADRGCPCLDLCAAFARRPPLDLALVRKRHAHVPPIADHLSELVERYPGSQLIIAHAGIADLSGLVHYFARRPGVYFDTSVWSPLDLLALMNQVSPEQVLYASDYPYGQLPGSVLIATRVAKR